MTLTHYKLHWKDNSVQYLQIKRIKPRVCITFSHLIRTVALLVSSLVDLICVICPSVLKGNWETLVEVADLGYCEGWAGWAGWVGFVLEICLFLAVALVHAQLVVLVHAGLVALVVWEVLAVRKALAECSCLARSSAVEVQVLMATLWWARVSRRTLLHLHLGLGCNTSHPQDPTTRWGLLSILNACNLPYLWQTSAVSTQNMGHAELCSPFWWVADVSAWCMQCTVSNWHRNGMVHPLR